MKRKAPAGADPVGACFLSHVGSFCRKTEYRRCQVPICRRILTTPPALSLIAARISDSVPGSDGQKCPGSDRRAGQDLRTLPLNYEQKCGVLIVEQSSRSGSGANTHKQKPPGAVKPSGGSFTRSCSDRRAVPACIYRSCSGCILPTSCTRGLQGCRQSPWNAV